ncbi:MAG: hypothetical protein V2B18_02925 [Pseudomonadota bacterium]
MARRQMDFRAIQVLCMVVSTFLDEIAWAPYGKEELHTPVITVPEDTRKLDMLTDIMGTLTRMMDTRINFVSSEGKIIREWIETILELGTRYRRELETLEELEQRSRKLIS